MKCRMRRQLFRRACFNAIVICFRTFQFIRHGVWQSAKYRGNVENEFLQKVHRPCGTFQKKIPTKRFTGTKERSVKSLFGKLQKSREIGLAVKNGEEATSQLARHNRTTNRGSCGTCSILKNQRTPNSLAIDFLGAWSQQRVR